MKLTKKIKKILSNNDLALENYPNLQTNKKSVIVAVKKDGLALEYASKRLKNDKEVVLQAVKQNGLALYYASDNLINKLKKIINNNN